MKSKKKKNKQNILIAYTRSIASMQGIELAMLFCHAGFSVKTILLDNSEKHISSELIKELTEHSSWSNSHKPKWVKADIVYSLCIIIEPSEEFQGMILASGEPSYEGDDGNFVSYIKDHCKRVKILQNEEQVERSFSNDLKKQIIAIPNNHLQLRKLFEKILADTVALVATRALVGKINYRLRGDFTKIGYFEKMLKAFADSDIEERDCFLSGEVIAEREAKIIITNEQKIIEVIFEADENDIKPSEKRIYVSKHKNGLILIDNIEKRLLPDFSCKTCFARFIEYLKESLSRK